MRTIVVGFFVTWLLLPMLVSGQEKSYRFDGNGISREVLENYLEKAVTMVYLLIPENPEGNHTYPYHADDIRMVENIGAKFIGRAIYRWGGETLLNKPAFWDSARSIISKLHAYDPDIIFQGCLFEIITEEVNQVSIPEWVFQAYGLPVESRNFSYQAMLNQQGKLVDHWHKGSSVPDISERETQLWFYFLACSYINVGCEAFHLGQIELIGMNDPERNAWTDVINKIRHYAKEHARRHWVLLDAHVPYGGMLTGNKSLLDFNSFPLRIKAIPEKPYESKLPGWHLL